MKKEMEGKKLEQTEHVFESHRHVLELKLTKRNEIVTYI